MNRSLLAVLAHPDDESYGIGGTLARYAAEGVDVHVAIATDGAAGSVDDKWAGDRSRLTEVRAEELKAAARILGVKVHFLGYKDSGYIGDSANDDPQSFMNVDLEEATRQVIKLIRELRPSVVVTHDETGGYFHPDHIRCCLITTPAFYTAGDEQKYPDIGPAPFQPQRLYYTAFPQKWLKIIAFLMRLRGLDPSRVGRNQDIDFTKLGVPQEMITTRINYRRYWEQKRLASAEHGSQGGGTGFSRLIPNWIQKLLFSQETYIRVHPKASGKLREKSLFADLY
jgi:mycothiol S-conjugate amidase